MIDLIGIISIESGGSIAAGGNIMKNGWPTIIGFSVILAGLICLSGCSGLPSSQTNTVQAAIAYMIGNSSTTVVGYATAAASNSSPINTITLPPSYYGGPLATDSTGQIYAAVAIDPIDPLNLGDIFIYPPNSTGAATPSRTINVNSYDVSALTVDPAGRLYVAINTGSAADAPPPMVIVYSATASGPATPLRTLQLTNFFATGVSDIAADAAGNIYVAGSMNTGSVIAVYPPTATGPATPTRTISLGNFNVYGVAVDPAGDILANVCLVCYDGTTNLAIEEFAPGADGAATPINIINLIAGSHWTIISGGPVRLDGAGNIFTSLELRSTNYAPITSVVYGFGPTATGNAVPTVQITPPDGYATSFALN